MAKRKKLYFFSARYKGGNNNGKDKNMRAGIKNATSEILLGQDAQIQEGYNTVKYVFEGRQSDIICK